MIHSFNPPSNLKYEAGILSHQIVIGPGNCEYDFIKEYFLRTFS